MSAQRLRTIEGVVLIVLACASIWPSPTGAAPASQPGMVAGEAATANGFEQLADGQFVYGPNVGNFAVDEYLASIDSPLLPHADLLADWCGYASVNPRVVLTFLEMRGGLVTGTPQEPVTGAAALTSEGFESVITGLVSNLALAFYEHLYQHGARSSGSPDRGEPVALRLADGASVAIRSSISSASYAILAVLAPLSSSNEWSGYSSDASRAGFGAVYRRLFPDSNPLDTSNSISAPAAPPTDLFQFPFPVGASWWFNGPHSWNGDGTVYGRPFSSMDFGAGSSTCAAPPGDKWTTAAAGGNGYHPNGRSCWFRIDHGGGWTTSYYHLRNTRVDGAINRNDAVGTIGCETCAGGSASGPHVHFSLLFNGAYTDLDLATFSGWTVHVGNGGYGSGYIERNGEKKYPYQSVYNGGIPAPPVIDLRPAQIAGWEYPVVPSAAPGTHAVDSLHTLSETYIDWGLTNAGSGATGSSTYGDLYIDDILVNHHNFGSVPGGQDGTLVDSVQVLTTPGAHTLKLVLDPGNMVAESDEGNNTWQREFYWAPSAPYADSMESEAGEWTADGLWHQSARQAASGSYSWWYGQDSTGDYETGVANSGDLTSRTIYIPAAGYYLRFRYRYETESIGREWDQRWVQIAANGGDFTSRLQLADDPMLTWLDAPVIDLSEYAGQDIRVRYHFDTLDPSYNEFEGWYIDDLDISSLPPASGVVPPIAISDVEIELRNVDVELSWSPVCEDEMGGAVEVNSYRIYGGTDPYFAVSPAALRGTSPESSFLDGEVLAQRDNVFYLVTSTSITGKESQASNRVGTFFYALEPGSFDTP